MGMDEFDPCCAIKSKANWHKILGVYFQIRNIPPQFASKLENIFLVALCESINFKQTGICDDNLIEEIVRDLKSIENEGIDIGNATIMKVGLFNVCCDNLGANVLLGFSGSFSADFYCRFCEYRKPECQRCTEESPEKLRSKEKIMIEISKLKLNPNLEPKETKGVRKNCLLNELISFQTTSNLCVDIMHDFCEGIIPLFLRNFFDACINRKIVCKNDVIRRLRDYNYGSLNSRNKPSMIKLNSVHLGQNSSQLYCIMIHLPFIFCNERNDLQDTWAMMINLLDCMRTVFSNGISVDDLNNFGLYTKKLLSDFIRIFKIDLTPKLHNLTHYESAIRQMGPLKPMWMMRFESKHTFLTDVAKRTNNYVNITKTMAETHQSYICTKKKSYNDVFEYSKKKYSVSKSKNFETYSYFLNNLSELKISETVAFDFLKFNGNMFRKGLMVISNQVIFEIIYISCFENKYFLFCLAIEYLDNDNSLNAVKIKKSSIQSNNFKLLSFEDITLTYCLEKKGIVGNSFIITENLEILRSFK